MPRKKPYREWTEEQKEKHRESVRRWKKANPEKVREQKRRRLARHPELRNRYLKQHPEKRKEYNKKHCGRYRKNHRGEINEYTKVWRRRKRLEAIKMLGGKCEKCGIDNPIVLQLHHKKGRREGESLSPHLDKNFDPENFSLLCANCHVLTHSKLDR